MVKTRSCLWVGGRLSVPVGAVDGPLRGAA